MHDAQGRDDAVVRFRARELNVGELAKVDQPGFVEFSRGVTLDRDDVLFCVSKCKNSASMCLTRKGLVQFFSCYVRLV